MAWKLFFKVVGVKPGMIDVAGVGKLNLANPKIPLSRVKAAYDARCPYLEPTERGIKKFYGSIGIAPLPENLEAEPVVLLSGKPDPLTDEQIVEMAEAAGLLKRNGNRYEYDGAKYGTKAILKEEEILLELRKALDE